MVCQPRDSRLCRCRPLRYAAALGGVVRQAVSFDDGHDAAGVGERGRSQQAGDTRAEDNRVVGHVAHASLRVELSDVVDASMTNKKNKAKIRQF